MSPTANGNPNDSSHIARRRLHRSLVASAFAIVAALSAHFGWLQRWDAQLLDVANRIWSRPAPDDIIIVAIDQSSLHQLGRWPWPRALHAGLLEQLDATGARAIAMDIIFTEPDPYDQDSDQALTRALQRNGKTVLPVLVEEPFQGAALKEQLPFASLATAAAGLGHVHVELDADGIARSVFLKEGLGEPRWPWLGLAMLRLHGDYPDAALEGQRRPIPASGGRGLWERDYHIIVPFAGPPGHFDRVSYADVLNGNFPADTFKGKWVLVGATATGLSDDLPTPVSGEGMPMPGVEFNANVLDTLRRGLAITPLPHWLSVSLTVAVLLLAFTSFSRLAPRHTLQAAAAWLLLIAAGSFLALSALHRWFPPASALLAVLLSYPVWSWLRLSEAMRFLDSQLRGLQREQESSPFNRNPALQQRIAFFSQIAPIAAVSVSDTGGALLARHGSPSRAKPKASEPGIWVQHGSQFAVAVPDTHPSTVLDLSMAGEQPVASGLRSLLIDAVQRSYPPRLGGAQIELERFQQRLNEVRKGTGEIRALRAFVDASINQMAEGFVVIGVGGEIDLINQAAQRMLRPGEPALTGSDFLASTQALRVAEGPSWSAALGAAFLDNETVELAIESPAGQDFLVRIAPLQPAGQTAPSAVLVNLADISQLRASERKRAEILGFVSHDLRSPLVSVLALVELARGRPAGADAETLSRIENYAQTTLALAEQILQLARAESPDGSEFRELEFTGVAINAQQQVWAQARAANTRLLLALPEEPIWLRGDAAQLERALVNLLNNAVKYSPENTEITLHVHNYDQDIHCCVEDQGFGIAAQDIDSLFYRFRRLDEPRHRRRGGVGLGLAFVKAVAEAHGGRIDVDSQIDKGSRFCLVLPGHLRINDEGDAL